MSMQMKIGILGSGEVAQTLGTGLIHAGHQVMLGSREASNEKIVAWAHGMGDGAHAGTFADAAGFGEAVVLNCTAGQHSMDALHTVGDALDGKILIDVANGLDFSQGMPPSLTEPSNDSLGEQIQRAFPEARVVKALNTVNLQVMVDPTLIPGAHNLFICGDSAEAKQQVRRWLHEWFGWSEDVILDLGAISASRATECFVLLWLQLAGAYQTPLVSVRVVHP